MAWCLPAGMWDEPLAGDLSTGINGAIGMNGGGGLFPAGTTLAGIVTIWNDLDRLTPYFWQVLDTPAGRCICVETSDPVNNPLPESLKNAYNGVTVNTPFSKKEVDEVKTQEQIDEALACFAVLFGCELNDLLQLDPLTKEAIVSALGNNPLPVNQTTKYSTGLAWLPGLLAGSEIRIAGVTAFNAGTVPTADNATAQDVVDFMNANGGDTNGEDFYLNEAGTGICADNPPGVSISRRNGPDGRFQFQLWAIGVGSEVDCQPALDCFEDLFGVALIDILEKVRPFTPETFTKDDIVAAVQAHIAANPGGPTPQTFEGELVGWSEHSNNAGGWNPPADFGSPVPPLGPVVNPAGTPGEEIGALFINPNIPAGCNGESFDFTYTILDATGGMGTVYAVEKSTGLQIPGTGYAPGAGGPTQGPVPFDHTLTFGPIPAGVDCTDICVVIDAFGVGPSEPNNWGQDEIDPSPSSLITVLPSPCAAAAACFESIFGCTIAEIIGSDTTPGGTGDTIGQLAARPYACAVGFVEADGTIAPGSCGFTLEKTGDGEYELTFDEPNIIGLSLTAEIAGSGSEHQLTYNNLGGSYRIETKYGDNGAAPDINRDGGFSVVAYCKDAG